MKKIYALLALLVLLTGIISCNQQRMLLKSLSGTTREQVIAQLGEPQAVRSLDNGQQLMIYESRKKMPAGDIATGYNRMDAVPIPAYQKITRTTVYLGTDGKVFDVKREIDYAR